MSSLTDDDDWQATHGANLPQETTPVGEWSESEDPYVIVHRVQCVARDRVNHQHHVNNLDYFDVPRLLGNANQTSILKGKRPLSDLEWYLEDNPNKLFAVINTYDCDQYHKEIAGEFQRLSLPLNIDSHVLRQIRPYLHVLMEAAKEAERMWQTLRPSSGLTKALNTLQSMFPLQLSDWNTENNLVYPYPQLWQCKDLLRDTLKRLMPEDRAHIAALLDFLQKEVSEEWIEAEGVFKNGLVSKQHWMKLYRPHEPIFTLLDGQPRAYMCKSYPEMSHDKLRLECWSWEFDGQFYRQHIRITIDWPGQTEVIPIQKLSHYPLRVVSSDLTKKLTKRGATFWSCRQRKYISYGASSQDTIGRTARQRYMIDMTTYNLMHPSKSDSPPPEPELNTYDSEAFQPSRLDEDAMLDDEPPDASRYPYFSLLLPPTIKGFGFHNKKWVDLLVERIEDISWDSDVFTDDLVLEHGKKELIQALVTVHLGGRAQMKADFMAGKGEGLLILLHGGPGTGKTLTAESVAELAERPLYRVTCGDIGTNPEEVERYLNSVLFIGGIWNCVVLLDEADVFLEERTKLDLQRNALVSVFLRVLEYYDGILILTSNRIGTFDEAFKSRVQLSLHYPPLKEADRFRIWENFIALLEDGPDSPNYTDIRKRLHSLASHNLNGRQIRNTMNTARQLAQYKSESFGYRHLNQAIQNVLDFENYVTTLREQTDEEWAQEQGLRHSKEAFAQEPGFTHSSKKRKVDPDCD